MMHLTKRLMLLCFATFVLTAVDADAEYYLELGANCISAEEPGTCMESYGFKCHRMELPGKSFEAFALGCNLALADGRSHFVQMLNDDGEWNIEVERTSSRDVVTMEQFPSDSDSLLMDYIQTEMQEIRVTSNGGESIPGFDKALSFHAGARKFGDEVVIRSLCGVNYQGELDANLETAARSACEKILLREIMIRSQFTEDSPYRAAGANDITWKHTTLSLVGDSLTLIVDGRHTFTPEPGQYPCRWKAECCSKDGVIYLDSCRIPTEDEKTAIQSCLTDDVSFRSDDYYDCLKRSNVKVGCESQDDGSRLCY